MGGCVVVGGAACARQLAWYVGRPACPLAAPCDPPPRPPPRPPLACVQVLEFESGRVRLAFCARTDIRAGQELT